MSITYFNPELSKSSHADDVLSSIRQNAGKNMEIHENMSSREISDVVSDRLISVVKKQFEIAKKDFQSRSK